MAAQKRGGGMKALHVHLQQAQTVSLFRQVLSQPSLNYLSQMALAKGWLQGKEKEVSQDLFSRNVE